MQKLHIISLTPLGKSSEKPESKKFTHDEVGYENPSTHPHEECDDCVHFIPETPDSPAGCEGVQRPIAEKAWCHRFKDKKMKHQKIKKTHITHHSDGSHTTHMEHMDGPEHDIHAGHADHDGMMDHIMEHTSAPNPGEAAAEAGPAAGAPGMPGAAPAGA
jgi:hypothetical protein